MKGNILMIGVVLIFLFVILTGLYFQVHDKAKDFEETIGGHQSKVLNAYKEGEKVLFFIEIAGRDALRESFEGLKTECGEYEDPLLFEGVPLLNTKERSCMQDVYRVTVDKLNAKLQKFPEPIPKQSFNIAFGKDSVFFLAKNSLRMNVEGKFNFENSKAPAFIKQEEQLPPNPTEPSAPYEPTNPTQPTEPTQPNEPKPPVPVNTGSQGGKCSWVALYAEQYVHAECPYSLSLIYGATPRSCHERPLTCATYVSSVYFYTYGEWIYGDGRTKCTDSKVIPMGSDVNNLNFRNKQTGDLMPTKLQPGDIFQAELVGRSGSYTPWGHTGLYIGRGKIDKNSYGEPYCYTRYTPDPNGDLIFAHSYGWEDYGEPGVCFADYHTLFGQKKIVPTNFCRYRGCV
jgi:hypothetical protein